MATKKYPTAKRLTDAFAREIARDLKPLGLYWRIAQFRTMAKQLVGEFGGRVPSNREALCSLTGVSDYVADAVLVFGFGEPRAVIDANVARILARHFGLRDHAEARRDSNIRRLADSLLPKRYAREYNFAMLDLAALVCTPANPKHNICPLRRTCRAATAPIT